MKKILIILFVCFLSTIIVGCNDSTIKQYTITFNSNGGTEVSSITQDCNTQVTKPTDPTKAGYTFSGWYSDSDLTQEYAFTTMPKENITLYAKWIEFSSEGLSYTPLEDNTCSVSGYSGAGPNVLIPRVYNGCLVTIIGSNAFSRAANLQSIIIPNSITVVGREAFSEATSLTSITIPNSVTTVGQGAFSGATSLTTVIFEEGSQLTTIDYLAFSGTTSLRRIIIPDSVTEIGSSAFSGATSLTNITIPNSVIYIGSYAFSQTRSLTSINVDVDNPKYSSKDGVLFNKNQTLIISYPASKEESTYTIPNSVKTIYDGAFYRATRLESINVDVDNPGYSSKDGVLFDKNQTLIISYPASKEESTYTIPDSVTKIGSFAFYGAKNLTSITIPNSVTTIGTSAFQGTINITSITIPNSVIDIGYYAFSEATSLTSITMPNSITTVGQGTFSGATSLTSITIPDSVTSIGFRAFSGATSLTSITIPDSVTSIGFRAFSGATSLTSITIPNSVIQIGCGAFSGTTSLTSINVDIDNSQFSSQDGVLFDKNQTLIIKYPASKKESTYTIPESVTLVDNYAFSGTRSLTSITIPNSVVSIPSDAFYRATSLTSINVDVDSRQYSSQDGVLFNKNQTLIISYPAGKEEDTYTIPDSVTIIGFRAFSEVTSLTSITIPNSVLMVRNDTFSGTTNLTSIIITAETPPSIFDFGITNDNLKIYVPSDYVSIYKTAWADYAGIIYPITS